MLVMVHNFPFFLPWGTWEKQTQRQCVLKESTMQHFLENSRVSSDSRLHQGSRCGVCREVHRKWPASAGTSARACSSSWQNLGMHYSEALRKQRDGLSSLTTPCEHWTRQWVISSCDPHRTQWLLQRGRLIPWIQLECVATVISAVLNSYCE